MDFLSSLHFDVKLLLVAGALALLAGLFTGSKRSEFRYMALFTLLMITAAARFHYESEQDAAQARSPAPAAKTVKSAGTKAAAH
jgi:hypothetical protein